MSNQTYNSVKHDLFVNGEAVDGALTFKTLDNGKAELFEFSFYLKRPDDTYYNVRIRHTELNRLFKRIEGIQNS